MIQFSRECKLSCLEGSWYKLKEKILICAPPELFSWSLVLYISAPRFPMDIYSFLCWTIFWYILFPLCAYGGVKIGRLHNCLCCLPLSSFIPPDFTEESRQLQGIITKGRRLKLSPNLAHWFKNWPYSRSDTLPEEGKGYSPGYSQILISFLPSIDLYKFPRGSGAVTWIPLISSKGVWGWEFPASTLRRWNS